METIKSIKRFASWEKPRGKSDTLVPNRERERERLLAYPPGTAVTLSILFLGIDTPRFGRRRRKKNPPLSFFPVWNINTGGEEEGGEEKKKFKFCFS